MAEGGGASLSRFLHPCLNVGLRFPSRLTVAITATLFAPFSATAWGEGFGALATFSSNYFYRGYSKSDNQPTVRANIDYAHGSGLFVGSWVSWVNFGDKGYSDRTNIEIYPYLGFNLKMFEHWRIETELARYLYDGQIMGRFSDYNEYSAALHYSDLLSVRFDFANDAYHRGAGDVNLAITGRYPVFADWEVSGGLGYNDAIPALEYNTLYWNLGVTWFFFKHCALDVRYVDAAEVSADSRDNALYLPELKQNFMVALSVGF